MTFLKLISVILLIIHVTSFVTAGPIETETNELVRSKRWGIVKKAKLWPNGVVYYKILCQKYTTEEIANIKTALQEIMDKTCVKFIEIHENSKQEAYVKLDCVRDLSCLSKLGYAGVPQIMNLARIKTINPLQACLSKRKIQHEFLHALGFRHELTSINRDQYLEIKYDNIKEGLETYFNIDPENNSDSYGCVFDYNSVMMPPTGKHAKNREFPSFVPLDTNYNHTNIGIAEGVSDCDITRINNMYCAGKKNKKKQGSEKINVIN